MSYIADVLWDEYEKWFPGDKVFIEAPTGTGKTTFIINDFLSHCKKNDWKITYLVPRTILKVQLERELAMIATKNLWEWEDILQTISVQTYQTIENSYMLKLDTDFIVCDECHYFLCDSSYNYSTWKSFEIVMNSRGGKIFISATMDNVKPIIEEYGRGNKLESFNLGTTDS